MARILIGDGFDFEGETLPTDFCQAVKFKYRPPLPVAVARFDRLSIADAETYANGYAEFLAEHIGEWDVTDENDKMIPIKKETFLKCRDWNFLGQLKTTIFKSETKAKDAAKKS